MRIFLIGFMGSGKSFWGRAWASHYNRRFIDLDDEIEKSASKSILDIFEDEGEDYFRVIEAQQLRTMDAYEDCIIACGGGTACFKENLAWMHEHGTTVYLEAPPVALLEKIMEEKDKRPLLKKVNEAELLFFIQKKLAERIPFYEKANYLLRVDELNNRSLNPIMPVKS